MDSLRILFASMLDGFGPARDIDRLATVWAAALAVSAEAASTVPKDATDWRETGEAAEFRRDSLEGNIDAGVIVYHCWVSCLPERSDTAIVKKA